MEKAVEDGCSPFSRLRDDIVVQIYNKVMDLKTLCYCQLISKRLGLIVFQADTISFNVPLRIDYENENRLDDIMILFDSFGFPIKEAASAGALDSDPGPLLGSDSFLSAIKFIQRFTKLKSVCIQFPSYVKLGVDFFMWRIKSCTTTIGNPLIIEAMNYILLPDDTDEYEDEDQEEEYDKDPDEYFKAYSCLMDVVHRFKKVMGCTVEFPLLEKIFVMDSRGIVTLSGREIDVLRNFLHSYGTGKHLVVHNDGYSD